MAEQDTAGQPSRRAVAILRQEFSPGGFGYGLRQQFLKATVMIRAVPQADWGRLHAAISTVVPRSAGETDAPVSSIADLIIHWTAELQRAGGQPVFDTGRVLASRDGGELVILALPTHNLDAVAAALPIVVDLLARLLDGDAPASDVLRAAQDRVGAFVERFSAIRSSASNTPHFLRAAYDNRMPWFRLAADVFQIGMGSKGRWLESSLTDATLAISMRLARSKLAAASMLSQVGLPVPRHQLVKSAEEAVAAARQIGYPVVVKPADRDGGVAVAAGLTDDSRVIEAYGAAMAASTNVMVEKHVEGRDFRLVVHNGRMIWALERVPGGVTGDGVSTVAQLVERLNREPARALRADAPLKPLVFDREAAELLDERGMTLESVPASGERIRLRRAANVASGGTPEGVFGQVHPDNRLLAERAAAALRLDLAGIDLLIPDISRSWKATGGAICEVNAQPTIGNTTSKHLYGEILRTLVDGDGRIPIAMVVGARPDSPIPALLARILGAAGLRTAVASSRQVINGSRILHDSPGNLYAAAFASLIDKETDAVVVAVSDSSVLKTCLPFDRCTTIVLAGASLDGAEADPAAVTSLGRLLLPISLGGLVIDSRAAAWRQMTGSIRKARIVLASAGAEMAAVRDYEKAGHEAVLVDQTDGSCRLSVGGAVIDLLGLHQGDGRGIACTPDDVAVAAAAALSMDYGPDIIRRGLIGIRLVVTDAADRSLGELP
jgi:cyanophycin synthetase